MSPRRGREHQHHYTATSPTTGAVTDLDFCADCGAPREPLDEGVYVSDWGDVVDTVSDRPRG